MAFSAINFTLAVLGIAKEPEIPPVKMLSAAIQPLCPGWMVIFDNVKLPDKGGLILTGKDDEDTPEPQSLKGVTLITPLPVKFGKLTVMELVPAPVAMVAPKGSIQE
jgi:uncharacterized membrane protein